MTSASAKVKKMSVNVIFHRKQNYIVEICMVTVSVTLFYVIGTRTFSVHLILNVIRQIKFQIFLNSKGNIGFNPTANKFFYLDSSIGLKHLNLNFIQFKKAAKTQFLKYGMTVYSGPLYDDVIINFMSDI